MDAGLGHPDHPSICVCSACALFRITHHLCARIDDLTARQASNSSAAAQKKSSAKTQSYQQISTTSCADLFPSADSEQTDATLCGHCHIYVNRPSSECSNPNVTDPPRARNPLELNETRTRQTTLTEHFAKANGTTG